MILQVATPITIGRAISAVRTVGSALGGLLGGSRRSVVHGRPRPEIHRRLPGVLEGLRRVALSRPPVRHPEEVLEALERAESGDLLTTDPLGVAAIPGIARSIRRDLIEAGPRGRQQAATRRAALQAEQRERRLGILPLVLSGRPTVSVSESPSAGSERPPPSGIPPAPPPSPTPKLEDLIPLILGLPGPAPSVEISLPPFPGGGGSDVPNGVFDVLEGVGRAVQIGADIRQNIGRLRGTSAAPVQTLSRMPRVIPGLGGVLNGRAPARRRLPRKQIITAARHCGIQVAAATFGLSVEEVCAVIARGAPRRRRGISAADMRRTRSTLRKMQTMRKSLKALCR